MNTRIEKRGCAAAMTERVWTIPNIITYARIGTVPVVAALIMLGGETVLRAALVLFILGALTDCLDGYLARRLNQMSEIGRMLDPIADKVMVTVMLLALAANGTLAGWLLLPAAVIVFREGFVSGLREFMAAKSITLHVTPIAKWKTATQLVAIGLLLAALAFPLVAGFAIAGQAMLWISAALTLYTGAEYFLKAFGSLGSVVD